MTVLLFAVIGAWCLLLMAIGHAAPFVLIQSHTSDGMNLRRYQAIYDARTSNTRRFILCNQQIHPGTKRIRVIRAASPRVAWSADEGPQRRSSTCSDTRGRRSSCTRSPARSPSPARTGGPGGRPIP